MPIYKFEISDNFSDVVEIEADTEEEARDIAWMITINADGCGNREVYAEGEV